MCLIVSRVCNTNTKVIVSLPGDPGYYVHKHRDSAEWQAERRSVIVSLPPNLKILIEPNRKLLDQENSFALKIWANQVWTVKCRPIISFS